MTKKELEKTDWAKNFKAECSRCYQDAIKFALDPKMQFKVYSNCELGFRMWAIEPLIDGTPTGFWMEAKSTKKEAMALCREMGWKVTRKKV